MEFAPAMEESTGVLPGLPAVAGKPLHVAFDGGRLTSDAGILLLAAIEQRLKIAERLAAVRDEADVGVRNAGCLEIIHRRDGGVIDVVKGGDGLCHNIPQSTRSETQAHNADYLGTTFP
jgi:hypothetical protein